MAPEIAYADNYAELMGEAKAPVVETKVVSAPVKAAAKTATAEVK